MMQNKLKLSVVGTICAAGLYTLQGCVQKEDLSVGLENKSGKIAQGVPNSGYVKYLGGGFSTLTGNFTGSNGIDPSSIDAYVDESMVKNHSQYVFVETKEDLSSLINKTFSTNVRGSFGSVSVDASIKESFEKSVTTSQSTMSVVLVYTYEGVMAFLNKGQICTDGINLIESGNKSAFEKRYGNSFCSIANLGGYLIAAYTCDYSSSSTVTRSDVLAALNIKRLLMQGSVDAKQIESMTNTFLQTSNIGYFRSSVTSLNEDNVIMTKEQVDAKAKLFSEYYTNAKNGVTGYSFSTIGRELKPYDGLPGSIYNSPDLFPTHYDRSLFTTATQY